MSANSKPTSTPRTSETKAAPNSHPLPDNKIVAVGGASGNGNGHALVTGNARIQTAPQTNSLPVENRAPAAKQIMPAPFNPAANGQQSMDQVMMQFQQTMLQMTNSFLETQQNVMLAYLNAKSGNYQVARPSGNSNTNNNNGFANQFQTSNGYANQPQNGNGYAGRSQQLRRSIRRQRIC